MSKDIWREFLEVYRDNPCLWDHKSCDYTNKTLRRTAEEKLLNIHMKIEPYATIKCVKKKIDSFRNCYRREYKKVLESMKVCESPEDIYTPALWYFNLMSFLEFEDLKPPERLRSVSRPSHQRKTIKSEIEHDMGSEPETEFRPELEPADTEPETEMYLTPFPESPPAKKKKMSDRMIKKREDPLEAEYLEISHSDPNDECSAFATNIMIQMRQLTDVTQKYIAQKLISDVMFLARTNQLNLNSHVDVDVAHKPPSPSTSQYIEFIEQ